MSRKNYPPIIRNGIKGFMTSKGGFISLFDYNNYMKTGIPKKTWK